MKPPSWDEPAPSLPPARCPTCRSTDLTTSSKALDRSTYWRCRACGEIWNVERRDTGTGYRLR